MVSPSLEAETEAGGRSPWPGRVTDLLALGGYLLLSLYLAKGLWVDPDRRALSFTDSADELLFQWYLGHAAHVVTHLTNPFFTTQMNMPDGFTLAGNASVMGLGIPLAP